MTFSWGHPAFTWGWAGDPFAYAFALPYTLPVFDPYWGWHGMGGSAWDNTFVFGYGFGQRRYTWYSEGYDTASTSAAWWVPASVDPAPQTIPLPVEPTPPSDKQVETVTPVPLPTKEGTVEEVADDTQDALYFHENEYKLDISSSYTVRLDARQIWSSYNGMDQLEEDPMHFYSLDFTEEESHE